MHHHTDRRYREGGLYDDVAQNILNDQRPAPDPNPSMDCTGCGETYNWKHFKNHGQASADPDEPLLCAVCNSGIGQPSVKTVEERREANHDLTEFAGDA